MSWRFVRRALSWLDVLSLGRMVIREAPWPFLVSVVLTVILAVTSALAVLVLIPLVQATGVQGVSAQPSGSPLESFISGLVGPISLEAGLISFVLLAACQALTGRLQIRQAEIVTQRVKVAVRRRLFAGLCRADWSSYSRLRSTEVTEVLVRQVDRVGYATHALVNLGASLALGMMYAGLALTVSVPVTLLILSFGALLALGLSPWRRKASRAGEALTTADQDLYRSIGDALGNMKLVKTFGREEQEIRNFDRTIAGLRDKELAVVGSPVAAKMWFDIGAAAMLAVGVFLAVRLVGVAPASLLVLLVLFTRLTPQLASLQVYYQGLLTDLPAVEKTAALRDSLESAEPDRPEALRRVRFDREVRLADVSFAYANRLVLNHVDVRVRVGETVAIVGPSGGGKTTLADIMLGLLAPQDGALVIDGEPLTPAGRGSWREQVGYVPQDVLLFHDTIRANLKWGGREVGDDELLMSLRAASAHFVNRLPQGLDTVVGDRGGLLSGGERQRLALARALLRRPKLLVLDEATSALDSESERAIQDAVERLHGRVAILIIAHRLSTVRRADLIHVLDDGQVVERGTWGELIQRDGRFADLCAAQGLGSSAGRTGGQLSPIGHTTD